MSKKLKMILLAMALAAAGQAQAATAYWTGRMEMAQSVTMMMGWRCQYQYGGKMFWLFFTSTCPSTVEIE